MQQMCAVEFSQIHKFAPNPKTILLVNATEP